MDPQSDPRRPSAIGYSAHTLKLIPGGQSLEINDLSASIIFVFEINNSYYDNHLEAYGSCEKKYPTVSMMIGTQDMTTLSLVFRQSLLIL